MRRQTTTHQNAAAARANKARAVFVPLSLEAADLRSDDGRRRVELRTDSVIVDRCIAGVRMRLAVAVSAYRGVALGVSGEGATLSVSVTLVHRDRDLDIVLFEASDDENVTAEWLYWSGRFGLPLLVAEHDGSFSQPYDHLGALTIGKPGPRRKGSILSGRRPRFLTRRRVGRTGRPLIVHREREIIARD